MGFSVMLWGAEKRVPAEYWCPYGTDKIAWIAVFEAIHFILWKPFHIKCMHKHSTNAVLLKNYSLYD